MNTTTKSPSRPLAWRVLTAVALNAPAAFAQNPCAARWLPGPSLTDVHGTVSALANWDPDGAGPLPSMVVVGGTFTAAGRVNAQNIALWNPVSGEWSPLGDGVYGNVNALAVASNNDLIVGGDFTFAGELIAKHIARWNGTNWQAMGAGADNGTVRVIVVRPNGDIVMGGSFTAVGGVPAQAHVASWDGSTWTPLGNNLNIEVKALVALPNGDLVANSNIPLGNNFGTVAKWTGSTWQLLGNHTSPNPPLAVLQNGDLVAGDLNGLSKWNGSAWAPISGFSILGQFGERIDKLTVLPNGDLLVAGTFSGGLTKWNGSTWSTFASLPSAQVFLGMFDGSILAGGSPGGSSGGTGAITRWNGSAWLPIGTPISAATSTLKLANGDVIVTGEFTSIGGVEARRIARWDGTSYSPLGAGLTTRNSPPIQLPDGSIVISGRLTGTNGPYYLLSWDGTAWSTLATINTRFENRLLRTPDGGLLVANATQPGQTDSGVGKIAKWNGTVWSQLVQFNSAVYDLAYMPNGDLVAGGAFWLQDSTPMGGVARWDGTSWTRVGGDTLTPVTKMAVMPNGDLVVGGSFANFPSYLARWNGTEWTSLGTGVDAQVNELEVLRNGKLAVGGYFTAAGGVPGTRGIACWDGANWSSLGGGITGEAGTNTGASSITELDSGDLYVSGVFLGAGGVFGAHMSIYTFGGAAPTITHQPAGAVACAGGSASLSVTSSPGAGQSGATSYLWHKDGSPLNTVANPSAATATLSFTTLQATDRGDYTCVVSNTCGAATSSPARLFVSPADAGAIGGTRGPDGVYDNNDFVVFINDFFEGSTWADIGSAGGVSGNDGALDNNDFVVFIDLFFAGC